MPMNPVLQMILNALVKYLEQNPAQVEQLVQAAVKWLIEQLAQNAPKP